MVSMPARSLGVLHVPANTQHSIWNPHLLPLNLGFPVSPFGPQSVKGVTLSQVEV